LRWGSGSRRRGWRRRRQRDGRLDRGRCPEQLVHLVDQDLAVERLDEVAVGERGAGLGRIQRLERTRQQKHRDMPQLCVGLNGVRQLIAVAPRHRHVRQDDGGLKLPGPGESILAVVHRDHREVFGGESDGDDLLNRDAVVREEQRAGH
jgi:hypothetical protein